VFVLCNYPPLHTSFQDAVALPARSRGASLIQQNHYAHANRIGATAVGSPSVQVQYKHPSNLGSGFAAPLMKKPDITHTWPPAGLGMHLLTTDLTRFIFAMFACSCVLCCLFFFELPLTCRLSIIALPHNQCEQLVSWPTLPRLDHRFQALHLHQVVVHYRIQSPRRRLLQCTSRSAVFRSVAWQARLVAWP
jgi:hypothetical protein